MKKFGHHVDAARAGHFPLESRRAAPSWYIRWPIAILVTLAYLRFAVSALAAQSDDAPAAPIVA